MLSLQEDPGGDMELLWQMTNPLQGAIQLNRLSPLFLITPPHFVKVPYGNHYPVNEGLEIPVIHK